MEGINTPGTSGVKYVSAIYCKKQKTVMTPGGISGNERVKSKL